MKRQRTYIVEELTSYYVTATSPQEAEHKLLESLEQRDQTIQCEVHERDVYLDPEQRLTTLTLKTRKARPLSRTL